MSEGEPQAGVPGGGLDPAGTVRTALRGVASVVAPTTLITALLYYFGWARTSWEAKQLGLEQSLLAYSTPDYVLHSLSSMFWPLFLGLVSVVAGLAAHAALVVRVTRDAAPGREAGVEPGVLGLLRRVTRGLAAVSAFCLLFGALAMNRRNPSAFLSLAAPLSIAVGIATAGYALVLYQRFLWRRRAGSARELEALQRFGGGILVVLLFLSIFWTVSHYAAIKGVDLALAVERSLPAFPDATLYSGKRLFLQPPVKETQLEGPDAAYRFSYSGLKFLFLANHRYFLRPSDAAVSEVNIIIPEGEDLRLELSLAGSGATGGP